MTLQHRPLRAAGERLEGRQHRRCRKILPQNADPPSELQDLVALNAAEIATGAKMR
jgi:hypothetical protein